ncbi:MAG: aspartate--tRNA(Asn) ligase [Thermoproteota archaeon]|nr:aspartate--tRNA(Asn) ligase [Candidatus Brockarchaeota archaeon]
MLEDRKRSIEVTPDDEGKIVKLYGWALDRRDLGGIKFIILADRWGKIQIAWVRNKSSPEVEQVIDRIKLSDVIEVIGRVKKVPQAPRGLEIDPIQIRILNVSEHPLPLDPTERIKSNLDTRLDARPLDVFRPRVKSIFLIKSALLQILREFFHENDFVEIITPRIIASATEGGAALFPLPYFDKIAYLAQSPQLFKEQMVIGFEKVFEIGPFFRAEPFNTTKHLNEFTSIDIEVAFADMYDVMSICERMIKYVHEKIIERCKNELETLGVKVTIPQIPLKKLKYEEVISKLNNKGIKVDFGDDIGSEELRNLEELNNEYYFITHWPSKTKPFYIKMNDDGTSESFDLNYGPLELGSGGTREENKEKLIKQLIEKNLNPSNFSYHLKAFGYGMPPHAGWGVGLERLLMSLLKLDNIREVVLYPRDRFRLEP